MENILPYPSPGSNSFQNPSDWPFVLATIFSILVGLFISFSFVFLAIFGVAAIQPIFSHFVKKEETPENKDLEREKKQEEKNSEKHEGENGAPKGKKRSYLTESDEKWIESKINGQMSSLIKQGLSKVILEKSKMPSTSFNPVLDMYSKVQQARRKNIEITRICLTGVSFSGKSTIIGRIPEKIKRLTDDYVIMFAQEAEVIIFQGGGNLNFFNFTLEEQINFHTELLKLQISLENTMLNCALNSIKFHKGPKKIILFCDRGLMDGEAYIPSESWKKVMKNVGLSKNDCTELRYDLVIHTLTSLDIPETELNSEKKTYFKEHKEVMMKVDENLRNIYNCHPQYYYVNNQMDNLPENVSSFEFKMRRVDQIIFKYLGLPCSLDSLVKKYYLKGIMNEDLIYFLGVDTKTYIILDQCIYHRKDHRNFKIELIRVQSTLQDEYSFAICKTELFCKEVLMTREKRSYYYKEMTLDEKKHFNVKRRAIDKTEYDSLISNRDTVLRDVYRLRRSFIKNNQIYWIDTFLNYLEPSKDQNPSRVSNKNKHELFSVLTVQSSNQFPDSKTFPPNFEDFIQGEITNFQEMYYETLASECYPTTLKDVLKTITSKGIATVKEVPLCAFV